MASKEVHIFAIVTPPEGQVEKVCGM